MTRSADSKKKGRPGSVRSLKRGDEGPDAKIPLSELSLATRQVAIMLNSGMPIHHIYGCLAGSEGKLGRVFEKILSDIEQGSSLANAHSQLPRAFDATYCALLQAGETSGQLSPILGRLALSLERKLSLQHKVSSALTYPLVLLILSSLAVLFFMFFLFPMMEDFFQGFDMALPLPTRILINARIALVSGSWFLLGLSLLAWFSRQRLSKLKRSHPKLELEVAEFWLGLPKIGALLHKMAICRFLNSFVVLLEAGMNVSKALHHASASSGNLAVKVRLDSAGLLLEEGEKLSAALTKCLSKGNDDILAFAEGRAPESSLSPMVRSMLYVGEEVGELPLMLQRAAEVLEQEVEYEIEVFSELLEPLIMAFMGGVVGFIVLAAVLPTVRLIQAL